MSEEKKDPKPGEEKITKPNGQGENKDTTGSDEEKVEISKTELTKLQKKSQDFDGIVEANKAKKRAGRTIPGADVPVKKEKDKPDDDAGDDADDDDSEEFVTKKDFAKNIEKSAIKEAQKDSETDENWDAIMEFYIPRHGKDTVDDILADIQTAKKVWKAQNPSAPAPEKKGEGDTDTISDLATDKGIGEGKDKKPTQEKKSILNKNKKTTMKDWYPKKTN